MASATCILPIAPAPWMTVTPPAFNPLFTSARAQRVGLCQVDVVILRRDHAGKWLAQSRMGKGQGSIGEGKQAAPFQNLFGYEDIFRQVAAYSVAHRHFIHAARAIAVTLAVIDRCDIHGGLNDVALARMVAPAQIRSHFDERHRAFIPQDYREFRDIPSGK